MDFLEGESVKLLQGDCLELLKDIPDGSIDAVMTDMPYGTTACKWDTVVDLDAPDAPKRKIQRTDAQLLL